MPLRDIIFYFHSYKLFSFQLQNEIDFTKFNYTIYKSEQILEHFFRDAIKTYREVVSEWEGFEQYLPKIDHLIKNIGAIGKKSYTPNSKGCGLNVLNHGDFHLRNILIKDSSEQKIENFSFVIIFDVFDDDFYLHFYNSWRIF